jgi:hypothetical protein
MITVHVWNFRGLKTAMGHASMFIGQEYVSWWPEGNGRDFKLPGSSGTKLPLYSVRHLHGRTFVQDQILEATDSYSVRDASGTWIERRTGLPVTPLKPHHSIRLHGLDEIRALQWWKRFNKPDRLWTTLGQNCSTTVARALMIAGADDFALGIDGWWHSWNMVWHPNDVLRYSLAVRSGLAALRNEKEAIAFIRRFRKSPFGLTSLTISMDEQGLAKAIHDEVGSDTERVKQIFRILDRKHNEDADDVAELYVNRLKTKRGLPLSAVAKDSELKSLLIRVLDEGWTTEGEKNCIAFLKSLR